METILRYHSSLFWPSIPQKIFRAATNPSYIAPTSHSISRRSFSQQRILGQDSTSTPRVADHASKTSQPSTPGSRESRFSGQIKKLIKETLEGRPSPGGTRLRVSDTMPSTKNRPSNSSFTAMKDSYASSPFGDQGTIKDRQGGLARDMIIPPRTPLNPSQQVSNQIEQNVRPRAVKTIKSRPSLGRSIEINLAKGRDLGRSLKLLQQQCSMNNVQRDQAQQRFYERPGLKRKRLRSERYRARFKAGFHAIVEKVKAMKRKGW